MRFTERLPAYRLRQAIRRAWACLPWASQRVFVEPYTMLTPERLAALERLVRSVVKNDIPGHVVECGTAEGGSAALLALWLRRLNSTKTIYVFDTFEGLPPPTASDPDYERAVCGRVNAVASWGRCSSYSVTSAS